MWLHCLGGNQTCCQESWPRGKGKNVEGSHNSWGILWCQKVINCGGVYLKHVKSSSHVERSFQCERYWFWPTLTKMAVFSKKKTTKSLCKTPGHISIILRCITGKSGTSRDSTGIQHEGPHDTLWYKSKPRESTGFVVSPVGVDGCHFSPECFLQVQTRLQMTPSRLRRLPYTPRPSPTTPNPSPSITSTHARDSFFLSRLGRKNGLFLPSF